MTLTFDDVTSKTNNYIVTRSVDIVYKSSPVLTRFRTNRMERFEGGTFIQHQVMYQRLKGGAFNRGGSFDTSYVQTDTALTVNIKYYYVGMTLYGQDGVLNRGPEAAMLLVENKMANASLRMAELLGTDLFLDGQGTNSASNQLDGLDAAIDDGVAYATYAGVTRTDISATANTGINAYVAYSVGSLSLQAVQTAFGAAWFGNEHVDLIATTQTVWDVFWSKIQPQQRFEEESSDVAKIGFRSMRFNGSSVTVDQYCPAGYMFGLNTKYIQFWITTMPKYQFGFTGWKENAGDDNVTGQYLFAGNLLVVGSRLMFKLTGITG